jgi:hypothetical protein
MKILFMKDIIYKNIGIYFFSLLLLINILFRISSELNKFLLIIILSQVIYPIIEKHNPFKKQQ